MMMMMMMMMVMMMAALQAYVDYTTTASFHILYNSPFIVHLTIRRCIKVKQSRYRPGVAQRVLGS